MLFVVNIYNKTGQEINFGMVDNEFCRLVDMQRHTEMCRYKLNDSSSQALSTRRFIDVSRVGRYQLDDMASVDSSNTLVMCKLFRGGINTNMWRMQALGLAMNGPATAVELARTNLLDTYMLKQPVYSPVPPPACL